MQTDAGCRRFGGSIRWMVALAVLLARGPAARASVAVLLEEPYGRLGLVSPSGHTAVYLDHVCTETPVRLRSCRPGELGSVISRYDGIGTEDWIAVPLLGYLYAVDRPEDIPVSVDRAAVARLRDGYRRRNLQLVAADRADGSAPDGNWYELAGASFDRTIFGFQVQTSTVQDEALMAYMNDHQNRSEYNGAVRNCADFVRTTVNRFYPGAIRRNYVADFGLTSPKSVARGLTHFAARHPEAGLVQFQIAQISGELPRSHGAVTLTQGITREFGLPLVALAPLTVITPVAAGIVALAYVSQGRFAEPREAPVLNLRRDVLLAGGINVYAARGVDAAEVRVSAGGDSLPPEDGEQEPRF